MSCSGCRIRSSVFRSQSPAVTALIGTPPYGPKHKIFNGKAKDGVLPLSSPDEMSYRQHTYFSQAAEMAGARYIATGRYWELSMQKFEKLPLHGKDNMTPSVQGSYLSALTIFRFLARTSPDLAVWAPKKLPPQQAEQLRMIASQ